MDKLNIEFDKSHYKDLVEQVANLIQCIDESGQFVYVNGAWKKKLCYTDEEIKNLSLWDIIHPEDQHNIINLFKECSGENRDGMHDSNFRIKGKDGAWLWIWSRGQTIKDENGNLINITIGTHIDMTDIKEKEKQLLHMVEISKQFIEHPGNEIDYQKIADDMLLFSNAKYVAFNIFEDNGRDFTTVGLSGIQKHIRKAIDILGYNIIGKKWSYDPVRTRDIQGQNITYFNRLCELTVGIIPEKITVLLEKMFNLGQVVIVKIMKDQRMLGDFTLLMAKGERLKFEKVVEIYASQVGLFLEKKKAEEKLYIEKEQFKTTLLSVADGVISTDNQGNIKMMNPIAEKLTGWTQEQALGKPLGEVFKIIHELTRKTCGGATGKVLKTGNTINMTNHIMLVSKTGEEIPVENSTAPIKDSEGQITGVVIVFRDFTEKREKQKHIEYLSFHDHLTGLYNRRYIEDAVKKLDTEKSLPLTAMIVDVNGLKLTNDVFGHEMGDQLLKTVADILVKACREDDIICRIGGDEFAILLPNTDKIQAEKLKQKINWAASKAKLDSVIVSLAVGYCVKTSKDENIEKIKMSADNHMYKNKLKYGKAIKSQIIETVIRNNNLKYDQEQIHTDRVSRYCEAIARAMMFSEKEIESIKTAGILHDLGKVIIPSELLNKSGELISQEFEVIKRHPEIGYQMLKSVGEFVALAESVLYHHERWDGKGYPEGLEGTEIPLEARIITVADAYEAMTAKRPYQKTRTKEEAIAELKRCAGTQFDPDIVQVFVEKVL